MKGEWLPVPAEMADAMIAAALQYAAPGVDWCTAPEAKKQEVRESLPLLWSALLAAVQHKPGAAIVAMRDALTTSCAPVVLGPFLFRFSTFDGWVSTAPRAWRSRNISPSNTICVDSAGRICRIGRDFMTARDEGTFPVRVYLMREDMQPAAPKE